MSTYRLVWPEDAPTFAIVVRDEAEIAFFRLDEHRIGTIGYAEVPRHFSEPTQDLPTIDGP
jgi:hypothetical protein